MFDGYSVWRFGRLGVRVVGGSRGLGFGGRWECSGGWGVWGFGKLGAGVFRWGLGCSQFPCFFQRFGTHEPLR